MNESSRGRPKGSRNRITNQAKEAIQMAFDKLGGVDRLVAWAKEDKANEFAFYTKIYPMLLPRPAPEPVPEPEARPPVTGALVWKMPDWAETEMAHRSVSGHALRPGSGQAPGPLPSPAPSSPESRRAAGATAGSAALAAEPWAGETGPPGDGES